MTGHETEVKFFVKDLSRVEMRLHELKAHLIQPRAHETNLRFDNANNDLRKEMKVLRLRNDTEAIFTFKGPNEARSDGILSRQEIEFTVGSFGAAKDFLEALGFTPIAFYEKYRTTYELNNTHIMLDELPYGNFVEIEGEDPDMLHSNTAALGLNWNAPVKMGYLTLFERMAKKYNLDAGQLSFNAVKLVQIDENTLGALGVIPAD
ncbi:MAG: class IV adenylate cyclase [Anaerolineales bacterium]|nr:class IV adenylate cyclase [Anaerolineales bacterium]MCB9144011.1 class IV adenylate cyclase [Anaerolineales bacterium]